MDVTIAVKPDLTRLKRFEKNLRNASFKNGISVAVNKTLDTARDDIDSRVGKVYKIPEKYLASIKVLKSNKSTLTGHVVGDPRPLPLRLFSPVYQFVQKTKQTKSKSTKGKKGSKKTRRKNKNTYGGVSVEVLSGSRNFIPYAFMIKDTQDVVARGYYLKDSPFGFIRRRERVNKEGSDTPITSMLTVSVNGAINNRAIRLPVKRAIKLNVRENIISELTRRVNRAAK